jgi:hypothetical protein
VLGEAEKASEARVSLDFGGLKVFCVRVLAKVF